MLQKILSFSEDLYLSHFETVVHGGDDDYDGGDHDRGRMKSTREVSAMLRIRIRSYPNTAVAGFVFQIRPKCDKL